MPACVSPSLQAHFADLPDPRIERTKRHQLLDIITIAVCAVVCGADSWTDVEAWGNAKLTWLRQYLALPNGIPSHDTFGRVFAVLDHDAFERCFLGWVQELLSSGSGSGSQVAIDGKVLRGSHDHAGSKAALNLVSAWATDQRVGLGQVAVAEATNEIPTIPILLDALALRGCIVTIDSIGTQRVIAQQLAAQGADYVLALKANQPQLYGAVETFFNEAEREAWRGSPHGYLETREQGHGRVEVRQHWTVTDPELVAYLNPRHAWPGLASVGKVIRERRLPEKTQREVTYYLSTLDGDVATFARVIRAHWGIENGQHWVLDIAFREDESRVRTGHAAENFGILRRIALNLLGQERTTKGSIKTKRLRAGWDDAYLLKVLNPGDQ
jgi:predicted transposase YbfD/YdcC